MNANDQIKQLQGAGFSDDEITQWSSDKRNQLQSAGFSGAEVDNWFGQKEPNLEPVKKLVQTNLSSQPEQAKDFMGALEAGLQISVSGLLARKKAPDKVLSEDAPMASRIAANVATVAGDIPFMAAGAILGGGAGIETGPGAAMTAMAGAFGLPAGLRATLMDSYEKGDFKSFGDFWERGSGIIWQTIKGELTGAATAGAGIATKAVLPAVAPTIVKSIAPTTAEIAAMTTVGKALDGEIPKAQDFLDAAVIIGGMKIAAGGAGKIESKLRDVYAKTGVDPKTIIEQSAKDPTIMQDLVADNKEVPDAFKQSGEQAIKASQEAQVDSEGAAASMDQPQRPLSSSEPTEQQKAVLDRISVGEKEKRSYDWENFYTDMKDELYPIKSIVNELTGGEKLPASKDPYILARLTRGAAGKAEQFIDHSPFKFNTYENVGKSLKSIVAPVKNDLDGLRSYAVAKRSLELSKREIETGVPLEEARKVVNQGGKYEQVFKDILDYQEHLVGYLVDSGVISKENAVAMREANKDYVPFYRLMEEKGAGAGPGISVRSPIKSIKGSERKIIDPLESIVKNTYLYTTLAERNAVGNALVDLAEKAGREDLVKKVTPSTKSIEVQDKEVQKFLDTHGIEGDAESFSIFRKGYMNPAEDQIAVFRDGKREIYQLPKEVAAAFKATDRETAGILTKILAIPAKTLRAGATLTPDFLLRNMARDQLMAAINSKNGYIPVVDFMRGVMSLIKKDEEFQAWLKSGGANAAMISMDRQYLQMKIDEISEMKSVSQKVWNVVKLPIELLRIGSELAENATRLGEFKKGLGGEITKESAQTAGFDSREVTLDFARIGAKTRAINMITAFWNAQVEGVDRVAREFKTYPLTTTMKVGSMITLPSILLWYANHDDPRWKEIPDWERDLFWIVMTKDHVFRIPKPFELGVIFGSLPERMMDKFFDDKPDAFHAFSQSVMNVFGLNVMPTAATPVLEQVTNHSFFADRPLIPSSMEKILPEYQYSAYTSETTKALAQLIGSVPGAHDKSIASPIVIDNYVRGWSGTLGTYAVQIADAALRKSGVLPDPVKPADTLADIPVIKAFVVRYPSAQAQSIQNFHEDYQKSKTLMDTITYLAKQGNVEATLKEARAEPSLMIKLDGIQHALSEAQQVIQLIYKNQNIPPDERRQLIDATYMQMIEMAVAGNETIRTLRKNLQ